VTFVTDHAPDEGSAIDRLVAHGRAAGQRRVEQLRERYGDLPLVDLGLGIYQRDREAAGGVVGAAVAFRIFLFFVPLLLVVVGTVGLLSRWIDAEEFNQQAGVSGGLAAQISTALSQPDASRWGALIVGLVGVGLTGRSLSKVLTVASCLNWRLPVRTKAPLRVVGGVVGVIVGIGLVSAIVNRVRDHLGLAATGFSFLAVFAVYALAWMAVSLVLPRATSDPGALLPGSALVGLTITGMQAISQLYLPSHMGRASQLYGAIGATIVTLGWFFFAGRAIVLGMAVNAAVYERFGSISQVVFALPVIRVLPRRSAWIRRFFDLSGPDEDVEGPEGGHPDEDGDPGRAGAVDGHPGDGRSRERSDST
jgi:membrane protein